MKKAILTIIVLLLILTPGTAGVYADDAGITLLLDDCDVGTAMSAQYVDTYNMVQGEGCVVTNYWGFMGYYRPMDFSAIPVGNAYLEFYLYIDDLNLTSGLFLSLNSSAMPYNADPGNPDSGNDERHAYNEFYWDISGLEYRRGWNYVSMKLSAAEIANGAPDFTAITQFRLVVWRPAKMGEEGLTSFLKLDYITVTDTPKTVSLYVLEAADVDKRHTVPKKVASDIMSMYDKGFYKYSVVVYIVSGVVILLSGGAIMFLILKKKGARSK